MASDGLEYWDEPDDDEVLSEEYDDAPLNVCACDRHGDVHCHRTNAAEDTNLCPTCATGNCVLFNRPNHDPIHSRGLKRGKRAPGDKHAEDLANTLSQLRAEHERDAELSGDEPSVERLYSYDFTMKPDE